MVSPLNDHQLIHIRRGGNCGFGEKLSNTSLTDKGGNKSRLQLHSFAISVTINLTLNQQPITLQANPFSF